MMLVIMLGMVAGAGLALFIATFLRPVPHLADTLHRLSRASVTDDWDAPSRPEARDEPGGGLDRHLSHAGGWLLQRTGLRPTAAQAAQLRLSGISPAQWYGTRILCAVAFPVLLTVLLAILTMTAVLTVPITMTAGAALVAAVIGWFYPALRMQGASSGVNEDTHEALLVYIDLVILERMADKHSVDALVNASSASDHPLFRQIRGALLRAELERELPWDELDRLAEKINLPELNDITSIAKLQREGGSLEAALRARVSELRHAHTIRRLQVADSTIQAMEIPRTLPVLVVAALFIAPPLLAITGG